MAEMPEECFLLMFWAMLWHFKQVLGGFEIDSQALHPATTPQFQRLFGHSLLLEVVRE